MMRMAGYDHDGSHNIYKWGSVCFPSGDTFASKNLNLLHVSMAGKVF